MTAAASTLDWSGRAAEVRLPRHMIIGGELRSYAERGDFGLISPRDGQEIIRLPNDGTPDMSAAVSAAGGPWRSPGPG